jgi:IS605 OrfB family transposase
MGYNTRAKTVSEKIVSHTSSLDILVQKYNEVISYFLRLMDQEFDLSYDETQKDMLCQVEIWTNKTNKNPKPKHLDYNTLFPKFPCYLRRAAIAAAYGKWSSWRSNYQNWHEARNQAIADKKKFTKKAPTLTFEHNDYPVLYKGNMFDQLANKYKIKVFKNNDWVWEEVEVKVKTDLTKRGISSWKECAPKLVKRGTKYFFSFAYTKDIPLHKEKELDIKILSVDLGLTNSAVCSVMDNKGTVFARLFINQAKEKDHFYHLTNQLKKAQRRTKFAACPRYWNAIRGLLDQIMNDTAHQIVEFAQLHGVKTIVFEHLGDMRVPKGMYGAKKLRFKLHFWRRLGVQKKVEEMAHYLGMRISRVLANGTSKYAFDGSGEVTRSDRKDLCTFQSGKQYHADLNASYNIGARFFLRAIIKPLPEKERLGVQAKVPELLVRTQHTLATLRLVNETMECAKNS